MSEGEFKRRLRVGTMTGIISICPHDTVGECDCHVKWVYAILEDAKKDIIEIGTLETIRDYILKYAEKLPDGTPIFSAREFAKKLDEHRGKLQKWFGT